MLIFTFHVNLLLALSSVVAAVAVERRQTDVKIVGATASGISPGDLYVNSASIGVTYAHNTTDVPSDLTRLAFYIEDDGTLRDNNNKTAYIDINTSALLWGMTPPSGSKTGKFQKGSVVAGAGAWLAESPLPVNTTSTASYQYTFTTFLGDAASQEKLSIYTSTDGLNFSLLSNTGYAGPTGVLRDPSIMHHSDGRYYITYTPQSWTTSNTNFEIASSDDLVNWTYLTSVTSTISNTHAVWAPEWFKDSDGSINILVAIDDSGNGSNFNIFKYTATSSSLTSWSGPTELSGLSSNSIDPFVVKVNGVYNAFVKNETTKYIERATATNLAGPYTLVGTGDWAGWGQNLEGPALYPLDNGNWRIIMDGYAVGKFYYSDSSDTFQTWTTKQELPNSLSGTVRHGTVLAESTSSDSPTSYLSVDDGYYYLLIDGHVNLNWLVCGTSELQVFANHDNPDKSCKSCDLWVY